MTVHQLKIKSEYFRLVFTECIKKDINSSFFLFFFFFFFFVCFEYTDIDFQCVPFILAFESVCQ